jgi:multidrug efflux pump subunit AcrA (membrane-fusion protein)
VASISAGAKSIANKALKKAKAAQSSANSALSAASGAQSTANTAQTEAKKAQTTANTALGTANTAKSTADTAKSTADAAKAAAATAEANAKTRFNDAEIVFGTSSANNNETPKTVSASCGEAGSVMGGGFFLSGESEKVTVSASAPDFFYGEGWFTTGEAISGTPTWAIQAAAICGRK